jgi:general secretion pathway protein A
MFESYFGLRSAPFQLSPDPAFYYESREHAAALAYLKFGVYQREGFIVITGEIGAGKTTLVRTLLQSLDPAEICAAQVVNTQLDSTDLLRAICTAYGIAPQGDSKAQMISTLEAFFTAVAAGGRRALLVIDEAQNLGLKEVEELRMLSNFQLGSHALLQSFLVGQPELRHMLRASTMEQLRQRVIASCHLGPLSEPETRAYIEHRLRQVGWKDDPHFAPETFGRIHEVTSGIPRRINLLCNRLLLATFLAGRHEITQQDVSQISQDLHAELGVTGLKPAGVPAG